MYRTARQDKIMQLVNERKMVKLTALVNYLDVSIETVRRDVQDLVDAQRVEKIYGGIKAIQPLEALIDDRLPLQSATQRAIAARRSLKTAIVFLSTVGQRPIKWYRYSHKSNI